MGPNVACFSVLPPLRGASVRCGGCCFVGRVVVGFLVEFKSSKTTKQNRKVLACFLGVCCVTYIGEQQYCLYFHIIECGHKDETFMRLL